MLLLPCEGDVESNPPFSIRILPTGFPSFWSALVLGVRIARAPRLLHITLAGRLDRPMGYGGTDIMAWWEGAEEDPCCVDAGQGCSLQHPAVATFTVPSFGTRPTAPHQVQGPSVGARRMREFGLISPHFSHLC